MGRVVLDLGAYVTREIRDYRPTWRGRRCLPKLNTINCIMSTYRMRNLSVRMHTDAWTERFRVRYVATIHCPNVALILALVREVECD